VRRHDDRALPGGTHVIKGKSLIVGLAIGAVPLLGCSTPPRTDEEKAAQTVTLAPSTVPAEIMIVYQPAQICPSPEACSEGSELAWAPPGTTLEVAALHVQELPSSNVYWFRVEYEGRVGWISEFSTDKAPRVLGGRIVRE
jgi:hypothetical protein